MLPMLTVLLKGGVSTDAIVVTAEVMIVGMEAQGLLSITGTMSILLWSTKHKNKFYSIM